MLVHAADYCRLGNPVPLSDLSVTTVTTLDDVAVVFLTADICVAQHAEVRVAYSIDGGDPQVLGPTNLANHLRYCATRATMAVVPLPDSHAHTITPYWLVSGAPGKRATFVSGCLASQRELIIP